MKVPPCAITSGGTPKFYLKSETRLTKEQAETMRAQWMEAASSRNGAPPIIPPHITPTEMSFDPSELALLDQHEFSAKAIATAYGVPAVLLNQSVDGFTYQNPALLGEMWWRFELHGEASRMLRATVGAGVTVLLFAVARLIGIAPHEVVPPTDADLKDAAAIIQAQPETSPNLVFLRDKGLLFDDQRSAFVMYAVHGRTWAALGDTGVTIQT